MTDDNTEEKSSDSKEEKQKKFLEETRALYKESSDFYSDIRDDWEDDMEFAAGENHWPDDIKGEREGDGQATLTINRMMGFIRQVTNDYRQNRPSVKVKPADSGADVDTAEILQGLIRNIEAVSHADDAYDKAFFDTVAASFGFFRVTTDYIEGTFEQEIRIEPIVNPLTVRCDPLSRKYDGADSQYWFIEERMTKEDFEEKYPDNSPDSWDTDEKENDWYDEKTVRIVVYYYFDTEQDTLLLLKNGDTEYKSDYKGSEKEIEAKRPAEKRSIKWKKLCANEVLEEGDWAGSMMPIIPVYGDMIETNGDLKILSLIRPAKDAQRMYNYFRSTEAELMALQPKAPWIGAAGQFENYEEDWQSANRENKSFLEYNPTDVNGTAQPAPQRVQFSPPPSGMLQGAINAEKDMMGTIGIHEAGLGQRSNESSGKAILARQAEGDTSTYHFIDNMSKSIRRCGEVLVDLIPKIYDTPRVVRVLGEDGSDKMVEINQIFQEQNKYGEIEDKEYQLGIGRYDVVCSTGANYATRKEESKEHMATLLQGNPELWQIAGDLFVESMDFPDGDQIAERLRKTLPPNLQEPEEGEAPPIPPELQAQMEQSQAQIEEMGQVIEQMSEDLESQEAEQMKQANEQQKLDLEQFKLETERMQIENNDDLSEQEKVQFEADLKLRLQDNEIEHKENVKIIDAKVELAKANLDPSIAGFDDELNPIESELGAKMEQMEADKGELAAVIANLSDELAIAKEPKQIDYDEAGNAVGVNGRKIVMNDKGEITGLE